MPEAAEEAATGNGEGDAASERSSAAPDVDNATLASVMLKRKLISLMAGFANYVRRKRVYT